MGSHGTHDAHYDHHVDNGNRRRGHFGRIASNLSSFALERHSCEPVQRTAMKHPKIFKGTANMRTSSHDETPVRVLEVPVWTLIWGISDQQYRDVTADRIKLDTTASRATLTNLPASNFGKSRGLAMLASQSGYTANQRRAANMTAGTP